MIMWLPLAPSFWIAPTSTPARCTKNVFGNWVRGPTSGTDDTPRTRLSANGRSWRGKGGLFHKCGQLGEAGAIRGIAG